MWSADTEVRDLRLRDPILQFRVQKGTSIWLLCLLCSSFSLLLVLPFLCLTMEEISLFLFLSLLWFSFSFFFFKFKFYENPTMKKMVFALLILPFKSHLLSLCTSFLSLSRNREWQCSDKNKKKNKNFVTFALRKTLIN